MGSIHISTNHFSMLQVSIFLCCSFLLSYSDAIDTISFNQSVQGLISNDQKIKLEFFIPENSIYRYVGVLYNVPVMSVIWVANRENPLNDSNGTIAISEDGNLVILDGQKRTVWSSNVSISSLNTSAQLLDTGNLVLRDNSNSTIIWESFRHASNSLVAGMPFFTDLSRNDQNVLTSWRTDSDPASGRFTCRVEPLVIPQMFVFNSGSPYWRSGPWNGQVFIGIPGMQSFYDYRISVVRNNPRSAYLSFPRLNSTMLYYELNSSGILREKLWYGVKDGWNVTWTNVENECDIYGKCGPFGICNAHEKIICSCMVGFEPRNKREWSAGNWISGCTRKATLQCGKNNSVEENDGFLRVETVKSPDSLILVNTADEAAVCGSVCLRNCSCLAYTYHVGIGCMIWSDTLVDVQKFSDGGVDLYIRLAASELEHIQKFEEPYQEANLIQGRRENNLFYIILVMGLLKNPPK